MSTITKEWLRSQISAIKTVGITDSNTLKAFEIALASLEAEPAYFINRVKHSDAYGDDVELRTYCYELDALKSKDDFGGEIVPVYTASPAPVALPVQHWEELCRQNPDMSIGDAIIRAAWWNHCAAMLQGAEPVMTAYKLPFEQWLSQQGERIEIDCGCVSVEVFMHWLRMAYGAGNSPVIPDGWVDCSERMPEENSEQEVLACFKGGDISTLYYFEGRWDDAYGIVPIRQDVTHWMPLPAAPQQEVKP